MYFKTDRQTKTNQQERQQRIWAIKENFRPANTVDGDMVEN